MSHFPGSPHGLGFFCYIIVQSAHISNMVTVLQDSQSGLFRLIQDYAKNSMVSLLLYSIGQSHFGFDQISGGREMDSTSQWKNTGAIFHKSMGMGAIVIVIFRNYNLLQELCYPIRRAVYVMPGRK